MRAAVVGLLGLVACHATAPERPAETGVVFLGDSFVQSFHELDGWFGPDAATWRNRGRGGQECQQLRAQLATDVDTTVSRTAVLLIGINDVVLGIGPDALASCLAGVVSDVQGQGVRVVVVTLLPVAAALQTTRPISADSANGVIASVNASLRRRAQVGAFPLADAHAAFLGSDGHGHAGLYSADGLHPNQDGLAVLAAVIAATLREVGALR